VTSLNQQQRTFARCVSTLLACLLLLQLVFAGVAVAAFDMGQGASVCTTQKASGKATGQPATPARNHRHGLCCVAHAGPLNAPPVKAAFCFGPKRPTESVEPSPLTPACVLRTQPKGAPQSPRAPPACAA